MSPQQAQPQQPEQQQQQQVSQEQLAVMVDIIGGLLESHLGETEGEQKYLRGRKPYVPTAGGVRTPTKPKADPVTSPSVPTPQALLHQRPRHPIEATPPQQAQSVQTTPPKDQNEILERVEQLASRSTDEPGTNLAHILRIRNANTSTTSQFEAMGVDTLEKLTQILNAGRLDQTGKVLTEYHNDHSPFVLLSQPRQTLRDGGIPAVVVGKPYEGSVHDLETAFPGVHFFPAEEAEKELERVAATVDKPQTTKSLPKVLAIRKSPFGRVSS